MGFNFLKSKKMYKYKMTYKYKRKNTNLWKITSFAFKGCPRDLEKQKRNFLQSFPINMEVKILKLKRHGKL